jgi:hypothetical protein
MKWLGVALLVVYLLWIRPPGAPQGYTEDSCLWDLTRQLTADSIRDTGGPSFFSTHVMAPTGASLPFLSWGLERDWLGAYVWLWDRTFPFLWVYFGATLLATYAFVGWILERMRIPPPSAWGLAAFFVLVNVPRHFKTWYHYEHLTLHWLYASIFLDAWIWKTFYENKRWSVRLELWRAVTMLGTLFTAGYFWGPMILEWGIVRAGMAYYLFRGQGMKKYTLDWRISWFPLGILAIQAALLLRWFLPLYSEYRKAGQVFQPAFFFGDLISILRPLWFEALNFFLRIPIRPLDWAETVLSVGWIYWIPALTALWLYRRRAGLMAPFAILMAVAVLYVQHYGRWFPFQRAIQLVVPFMSFFRIPSRWGLLYAPILGAIIALGWPELSRRASQWKKRSRLVLFLGAIECLWLLYPVKVMPAMPRATERLLEHVRKLPGTTVLDFPFCVAGGNGVCTTQMCPNYPASTSGICLREWHEKSVYGLYQGRMLESHCDLYKQEPYLSWFDAWREQRCLNTGEWEAFCGYLSKHSELSAVFVYPDIWKAARAPSCRAELDRRLGRPIEESWFFTDQNRGAVGSSPTRLLWYAPRCDQTSSSHHR